MKVLVLSGKISLLDAEIALLTEGIVVLETTRMDAKRVANLVRERMYQDDEEEHDPILHQSIAVLPDIGWTDYLLYTKTFPYEIEQAPALVGKAISSWVANGSLDKYSFDLGKADRQVGTNL